MGNCVRRCLKSLYRRGFNRSYSRTDARQRLEADSLIDDDEEGFSLPESPGLQPTAAVTEREKLLLRSRNYEALISEQRAFDAEIDAQLRRHEEELQRQEERSRAAAAAAARQQRSQRGGAVTAESASANSASDHRPPAPADSGQWLDDNSQWHVAGGEDDFDMFLDEINTTTTARSSLVPHAKTPEASEIAYTAMPPVESQGSSDVMSDDEFVSALP